jgi:hydroxypyruvate reductase
MDRHAPVTLARLRADAHACVAAAIAAVDPARAVARSLARDGDAIVLHARDGREIARHRGPVCVVGAGKAVAGMARAAGAIAGEAARGVVVAPHGTRATDLGRVELRTAAHPVPDAAGVAATDALLAHVRSAPADTLVLVLLSGGASALLSAPADGLTLGDVQILTGTLLAAGAEIGALNAVRKHCSRVQGGGLARAAAAAAGLWTLVLSDVVGDDLATIGSGPTVADPTTYAVALAVLDRYGIAAPPAVRRRLEQGRAGALPETAKADDPAVARGRVVLVGTNADAVDAAAGAARGYAVARWPEPLGGDASEAGRSIARALVASIGRAPVAIVAGGETTVRARPGGLGGRSQHLALAAALDLVDRTAVLLAAGTDGIDGPTDAAGACVDGTTIARARAAGFDPSATLARTDSHRLLAATGDLVVTGSTGTNVADVVVALAAPA